MTIAVTYEAGLVFQHFGHSKQFKLYHVDNNVVTSSQVVDTDGFGHGTLAGFLKERNVDVLICGGIGGGAQMALANAGIQLFGGVRGDADDAVEAFLSDTLRYNPCVRCDHHNAGHGCGEHSCGSHSCH